MASGKRSSTTRGGADSPPSRPAALGAKVAAKVRAKRANPAAPGRARAERPTRGNGPGAVSATERAVMIARAAYLRAERRGFTPGHELEDWLAAEREINRLLGPVAVAERKTPA